MSRPVQAFLHVFNGVHVSWKVQVGKRQVPPASLYYHRLKLTTTLPVCCLAIIPNTKH